MQKDNKPRSNSPTIEERESNCIPISQQEIDLSNKNYEIVNLVNKLIQEFKDVRTTKRLDRLWNSSINTRSKTIPHSQNCFILFYNDISAEYNNYNNKKRTSKNVPKSSKIAKERWAAVKKNQHEYKFWLRLAEIANLKYKLINPNYKYMPIRNKSKKKSTRSNNNNNHKQQHSLLITDNIKSRSNHNIEPLQKHEINKSQALLDNNSCENNSTTLSIKPSLYSNYFIPLSFIPFYLLSDYRQNIATSNMMNNPYNPYINYLHYNPQDYSVINESSPFGTNFSEKF
ncbi:specific transcriptional repressor [Gigaspora margarita]|uniref:Specific transcriptional repressor n=1 Tax=Gigaspora margarita TaxID=4874 RepID=A0A8H4AIN1_GIGMA|nr:specific transcriptional repressor [Gigaspora margarita]